MDTLVVVLVLVVQERRFCTRLSVKGALESKNQLPNPP
jgi:hypothetical protein